MKLWVQFFSSETRMKDFLAVGRKVCQDAASPGTIVDVHGTTHGGQGTQYQFLAHFDGADVIANALKVRKDGTYDAFLIANAYDAVLDEVREILDIPVLSALEISCFTACQMGKNFALIAPNRKSMARYRDLVEGYGLASRLVHIDTVDLAAYDNLVADLAAGKTTQSVVDEVLRAADRCLEKGAEVIIPLGPPPAILSVAKVFEYKGAPLIDSNSLLIKMGEAMAAMHKLTGCSVSRRLKYEFPPESILEVSRRVRQIPNL
jgi:allantoin racemase